MTLSSETHLDCSTQTGSTSRDELRRIFAATLAAIRIEDLLSAAIKVEGTTLRVAHLAYDLSRFDNIQVVAIGKAAAPMAAIAAAKLSEARGSRDGIAVLAIGPEETAPRDEQIEFLPGSHPLPDVRAFRAAERVSRTLQSLGKQDLVLFLISGGASAMLELPLNSTISLEETTGFYRALLHSGLAIEEMNALRKHFSAVKGGRLAEMAAAATQCTLLVSDVPGDRIDVIGSGPTAPDHSTAEECRRLLARNALADKLPSRVREFFLQPDLPETPKPRDLSFARAAFHCVLSSGTMLESAAAICREYGFDVVVDNRCDDWEYAQAADYLLGRADELARQYRRFCLLSAGEVTVEIPGVAGQGGRNQQFALYCATQLREHPACTAILSVGSDGIDGNSSAAGAVVDDTTLERAHNLGLSVDGALECFDSFPVLTALGDAIVTGPTGNNLRDLRILMCGF